MQQLHAAWEWMTYYPRNFKAEHGRDLLDAYPDYPVYSTIFFLWVVFYLPGYLERHKIHLPIKYLVAGWNLFLSVASTYGAIYTLGYTHQMFVARSFHNTACEFLATEGKNDIVTKRALLMQAHQRMLIEERHLPVKWVRSSPEVTREITSLYDGAGGFCVALFAYLKTPELLDTLFLVLQDKPVSFLHWYHHIVTAVYVWISSYAPMPSGIFFCAMNYFVHSIMYFYYFLVVLGLRKSIRPFAPVITLLQVTQMFFGMYITVYTYFQYWLGPEFSGTLFYQICELVLSSLYPVYYQAKSVLTTRAMTSQVPAYNMSDRFWGCDSDPTNMRMGMMMYGSYCVLFAVLFKELYLDKRAHKNSLVLARKDRSPAEKTADASAGKPAAKRPSSS